MLIGFSLIRAGPNGKSVPVQRSKLRGLTFTITAEEVGEHVIQVLVNGQHIKGSPFRSVYVASLSLSVNFNRRVARVFSRGILASFSLVKMFQNFSVIITLS